MTPNELIFLYIGVSVTLLVGLTIIGILIEKRYTTEFEKIKANAITVALGTILLIYYPLADSSNISILTIIGMILVIWPPVLYIIIHFVNLEKNIKKRLINKAQEIATSLNLEIINLDDDGLKQPLSNLQFHFKKILAPKEELYIYQREGHHNNKPSRVKTIHRYYYKYILFTPQTNAGLFICAKQSNVNYNYEQQGYILYNQANVLCDKFTIYMRNPNTQLLALLQNNTFIQLLFANESFLSEPLKFNFDKYQLEAFIQQIPNNNPQYGLLQFQKALKEETQHTIQELDQQIGFITSVLKHFKTLV